jgi:linearmycin/streptolysin S transport system permease protein
MPQNDNNPQIGLRAEPALGSVLCGRMKKLLSVTLKDLQLATRPRFAVAALLMLPLVVILVVVSVEAGDSTGILLPVVNEDHGPVADAMLGVLREHLEVRELDLPNAKRLVTDENQAPAVLTLPAGLSQRFAANQSSTLELLTDPAQWRELYAIRIFLLLADRKVSTLDDPFGAELLHMEEKSLTTHQLSVPHLEQRVPGLTVTFVLLNMVLSVAFAVRDEAAHAISARLAVAPVSLAVLLSGRAVAWTLIGTLQLLILLGVGHIVFGLSLGESPLAIILVAVCSVFSMAGFALVVATIARSREQVVPISLAAVFSVAMIGGCWWPAYDLPAWLQRIGQGTVTWWSMAAMHDVILRNRSVPGVAVKLFALVAQGLLWWAVALVVEQRAAGDGGAPPRRWPPDSE